MEWEDKKKKIHHRNDFKAMLTRYQSSKSRVVGKVFTEPESEMQGGPHSPQW